MKLSGTSKKAPRYLIHIWDLITSSHNYYVDFFGATLIELKVTSEENIICLWIVLFNSLLFILFILSFINANCKVLKFLNSIGFISWWWWFKTLVCRVVIGKSRQRNWWRHYVKNISKDTERFPRGPWLQSSSCTFRYVP